MADILDGNGLQISTKQELIDQLEKGLKDIYGEDINIEPNTPDGQLIAIISQMAIDIRERISDVYSSYDPDQCYGSIQDVRYKINNIERAKGSWTVQPVDITVSKTITLQGLDDSYSNPNASSFGVTDSSGNVYYLIDTTEIQENTTVRLPFRAKEMGNMQPTIGTLTEQLAPISGVVSVTNAIAPTSYGQEEETDEAFAIRRNKSVAIRGQGNIDSILSQILALEGVNDCKVYMYDNTQYPNVDTNGLNPHFIWVIVEGGLAEDIADVLYTNSGGAGMKGSITVDLSTSSGGKFYAHFDRPSPIEFYIKFSIQETIPQTVFDMDSIKEMLVGKIKYGIGDYVETSFLTQKAVESLNQIAGTGAVVDLKISNDNINWVSYLEAPTVASQFVTDATNITIEEINL